MKDKLLKSEIFLPFVDYNQIESKKENITRIAILFLISIFVASILLAYNYILSSSNLNEFIEGYVSTEVDIIALLLSFSIAYLAILISSDNNSIKKLKEYKTDKEIDSKKVSLYKILLIQITYTVYNEIVLLLSLLLHKFIMPVTPMSINIIIFVVNIVLLINILIIIFKNVKNVYLSFYSDAAEK